MQRFSPSSHPRPNPETLTSQVNFQYWLLGSFYIKGADARFPVLMLLSVCVLPQMCATPSRCCAAVAQVGRQAATAAAASPGGSSGLPPG